MLQSQFKWAPHSRTSRAVHNSLIPDEPTPFSTPRILHFCILLATCSPLRSTLLPPLSDKILLPSSLACVGGRQLRNYRPTDNQGGTHSILISSSSNAARVPKLLLPFPIGNSETRVNVRHFTLAPLRQSRRSFFVISDPYGIPSHGTVVICGLKTCIYCECVPRTPKLTLGKEKLYDSRILFGWSFRSRPLCGETGSFGISSSQSLCDKQRDKILERKRV